MENNKNYTKEQETIRMALTNYVGALYVNSKYTGSVGKSNVNAIIIEELTKLSEEDGKLDLIALKPILNAAAWILKRKKQEIENDANSDFLKEKIKPTIKEMTSLIEGIEKYVEKIK